MSNMPEFIVAPEVGAAPVLSTTFVLPAASTAATLRVCSLGIHEVWLDDRRVDDTLLSPGWTSYSKRLLERTIDLEEMAAGEHTMSIVLGNGWYRGALTWARVRAYGPRLAVRAQLVVETPHDTVVVATDRSWVARASSILSDDLYDGQLTDLRLPFLGDPRRSVPVTETLTVDARIDPQLAPDVRQTGEREPVSVHTTSDGRTLIDFGQNVVGTVRLSGVVATEGTHVQVRHAEMLERGALAVAPLRSARATDEYILCAGVNTLESRFTFHGFRYVEVTGAVGLGADLIRAVVVGSDLKRTGWFGSTDARLERLHANTVWSAKGNFVAIPTDCPQRDERLGWTGDISVFAPTAAQIFDVEAFLFSWLCDLSLDQYPSGAVPYVVPDVLHTAHPAAAGWGDAAVTVPWALYRHYGSTDILRAQYGSMKAWVDHVHTLSGPDRIWQGGLQFGDWVDPQAPPHDPALAQTDPTLVATAQSYRTTSLFVECAEALGNNDDAIHYAEIAEEIRRAFLDRFVTPSGLMTSDSQTAYALAIHWGLVRDDQAAAAGQRLVERVIAALFRVDTGFLGTAVILDALRDVGADWVAERMLLEESAPSWLYPVTMGATTIWERWDSLLPNGSINPGEMTSFNHYALGAVAAWMHESVAGLSAAAPGFSQVTIRPVLTGRIESARYALVTRHGVVSVDWTYRDGQRHLTAEVPDGVDVIIHRADGTTLTAVGGSHTVVDRWEAPSPPRELTVADWVAADALQRALTRVLVECGVAESTTKVLFELESLSDKPVSAVLDRVVAHDRARVAALLRDLGEAWSRR